MYRVFIITCVLMLSEVSWAEYWAKTVTPTIGFGGAYSQDRVGSLVALGVRYDVDQNAFLSIDYFGAAYYERSVKAGDHSLYSGLTYRFNVLRLIPWVGGRLGIVHDAGESYPGIGLALGLDYLLLDSLSLSLVAHSATRVMSDGIPFTHTLSLNVAYRLPLGDTFDDF